jgi:hypothetical protein
MKLEEILASCAKSKPDAWKVIPCGAPGSGPSFLDEWSLAADGEPVLVGSHGMRAAYRPDVSIALAWGLTAHEEFEDTWTRTFAHGPASARFVDFFYNGALVERGLYVAVDGGRCKLPIPQRDLAGTRRPGLWVTRWQHDFFALLNALEGVTDFDLYLRDAGFEVR